MGNPQHQNENDKQKYIHDCYNTIAAITCYAQFLLEDIPPESEMHKFANSIFVSSKRAKLLLDEMNSDVPEVQRVTKKVV